MQKKCPDCGAHGACLEGEGVCECKGPWSGSDCSTPVCNCNGRGTCNDQAKCNCKEGWAGDDCTTIVRVPKFEDTFALNFVFGFSTDGVQTDKNGAIPVKPFLGKDIDLSDWSSWSFLLFFLSEARKDPELLIRTESDKTWIEAFYEHEMGKALNLTGFPRKYYGAKSSDFEAYFEEEKKTPEEFSAWMKTLWYGTQRSARRLFMQADPEKHVKSKSGPEQGQVVQCSHENVILNPFMNQVPGSEEYVYDPIEFEKRLWKFMREERQDELPFVGFQPE
jgi:hypothetical protein